MTPDLYGQLLAFLSLFYEVVLLDLGTGITDPLAQFAIERADQVVVITTPEWITANQVLGALEHLAHERATVVLNKARIKSPEDHEAIEQRFREQRLHRSVVIPFDERLQVMLDSGTYSLEALDREPRIAVKTLGLAVAEQLV
jgi:MinD-like ATPase involved in chromosome partitioning or flagellar assembly